MRKELIETGKSVEEAIDAACRALGCDRSECEWEIIDLPKKSFFGLRTTPARVRVYVEVPEPAVVAKTPEQQPPRKEKAASCARHGAPSSKAFAVRSGVPKPKPPRAAETSKKPAEHPSSPPVTPAHSNPPQPLEEKEALALQYVESIVREMGVRGHIHVTREQGGICLNITGEGLGVLIGRRGETLDAIQYLAGLVCNRIGGDYLRVTIDCGDYRTKRKDTLEVLARKVGAQVLKTNTSRTLEPMNPFERRIIHATVSEMEGLTSTSVGEEPNRRVVITTPTAKPGGNWNASHTGRRRDGAPRRTGERDRRLGGSRRGGGDRRGRAGHGTAQQAAVQGPPKQTPEAVVSGDKPLYGKIDLE